MTERTVPTKYKALIVVKEVKKLSLRERIRLILGYNLLYTAKIGMQHNCGKTVHKVTVELTDLTKTPPTTADELHL